MRQFWVLAFLSFLFSAPASAKEMAELRDVTWGIVKESGVCLLTYEPLQTPVHIFFRKLDGEYDTEILYANPDFDASMIKPRSSGPMGVNFTVPRRSELVPSLGAGIATSYRDKFSDGVHILRVIGTKRLLKNMRDYDHMSFQFFPPGNIVAWEFIDRIPTPRDPDLITAFENCE